MTAAALCLALLLDASGSVRDHEWNTLAEGHAAAFETTEVRRAIRASGPVAVRAWHYSDLALPLTPWRILATDADAYAYARELRAADRLLTGSTATGDAMRQVLADFERGPCENAELVMDVATDGPGNWGLPASEARDAAIAQGVRVNVLAIETSEGDPLRYARESIVTPDGFVMRVTGWRDVPRAIVRKISMEIATR
jgi:hypothetical protein